MKKIIFTIFVSLSFLLTSEILAQLPAPALISPPNGANNVQQPITFVWTIVSGATGYRLQIYDLNQNLIVDTTSLPQPQCTVPTGVLGPNTTYQWRASAVNGLWSGFWSFTTAMSAPPAPTLLLPPNEAINVTTTPTFDWTDVTGATTYHIQVSLNVGFTNVPIDIPGLSSSQYVVTSGNPLANGTQYWWRVRANNAGGNSAWTDPWTFSTLPAPPPPPALIYPPNGASGISLTPNIDWSDVTGATAYWLQVATDANFQNIIINQNNLTASNYLVPNGLFSGLTVYHWRVASINVAGPGPFTPNPWNFTTMVGPPAAPVLLAPPNNAINVVRNPLFDWNTVPTALSYTIQVDTDPNFGNPIINQTVTASQYQTVTLLNYNTTYYWRVRATNSGGPGPWSSVWSFTTVPALPPAPILLLPPNGAPNISLTPLMDWSDVPEATSYRLQIATQQTFGNSIVLNIVVSNSEYSVPTGILSGGTLYWWRVASINAGGQGVFTPTPWNFTTKQTLASNLRVLLEGFYDPVTQLQVRDTITVFLASATSPHNFVDTSKSFLTPQGSDTVSFDGAIAGNYYIVVRHRNHLETWSSSPQAFNMNSILNYDFTTASNKAYGNNMKLVGSVWVFWGGDADQDGSVLIVNDYNMFKQNFGQDGYLSPDFNGDSFVDGIDLQILYNNFFKSKSRP